MKITKFSAQGYRSLRDVTLDNLGDFVVFYGPNGSGKSNVLRGIQALLRAAEIWAEYERPGRQRFAEALLKAGILDADTPHLGLGQPTSTVLDLEVSGLDDNPGSMPVIVTGHSTPTQVRLRLEVIWNDRKPFDLQLEVWFDGEAMVKPRGNGNDDPMHLRMAVARIARALFWAIDAARRLRDDETIREGDKTDAEDPAEAALREGKPQTAAFYAKNVSDASLRTRFESLRGLVANTLDLPPLDVAWDPRSGRLDLRQPLRHAPELFDVSMRNAGLGVEQVVAIAASLVFARARVVAIEEPEAHLHAPTTGRALRKVLSALVHPPASNDGQSSRPVPRPALIDQLFIATHSNLFDLDPTGYWDVSLVDGATRIVRRPLHELYADHLYEPGPALNLLRESLFLFGDGLAFRSQKDGRAITAKEMIQMLDNDDDLALEFLRGMHAAALANLRVEAEDAAAGGEAIEPGEKSQ